MVGKVVGGAAEDLLVIFNQSTRTFLTKEEKSMIFLMHKRFSNLHLAGTDENSFSWVTLHLVL